MKNAWFLSYRKAAAQMIRSDIYDKGQNALIEYLLAAHPPIVATLEAVPDEIVAWACRSEDTIHYVYTKFPFRRAGIATDLVRGARFHTHHTAAGELLFRPLENLFNPYLLQGNLS